MIKHTFALPADGLFLAGSVRSRATRIRGALSAAAVGVVSSLAAGMWSMAQHTYTISIVGTVPAICHAELNGAAIDTSEGIVDLGTMVEFCNSASGYQVWLETTPSAPAASVYVDSARYPLAASGATLIHQSATAARRTSHLYLDPGNARIEKISVRIVPL